MVRLGHAFASLALALIALALTISASAEVKVYPADNGECEKALLELARSARVYLDVYAHTFALPSLTKELVAAKGRGVSVRVILDRANASGSWTQVIRLVPDKIPVHGSPLAEPVRHSFLISDNVSATDGTYVWNQVGTQDKTASLKVFRNEPAAVKPLTAEFARMWNDRRYTDLVMSASGLAQTAEFVSVDARTLFDDYERNVLSADLKWLDRNVRVSGEIWAVDDAERGPIVSLRVTEWVGGVYGTEVTKGWVFCLFMPDDRPFLLRLAKGSWAYIKGVCRGRYGTGSSVVVGDCSLSDKDNK